MDIHSYNPFEDSLQEISNRKHYKFTTSKRKKVSPNQIPECHHINKWKQIKISLVTASKEQFESTTSFVT